uniref:Gametogenetin-binding protein 2 n=1 Tax=Cyprinus carpio carpio TaxID=630221 RepID=A0A8C1DMS6_CYPCA
ILFYLKINGFHFLYSFMVQGISRLEQLCEELSEEERAKELKQEKKRQKRKNRRKNKCGFEQEVEGEKDKSLDEGSSESVDGGCKSCGSGEESVSSAEVIITSESSSCTCSAASILHSPQIKKALLPHSNGSDCGYCSSMEGSETGSREGSDVACTEGMCNHDETGEYSCSHHCSEEKEEDAVDSCVECWANSEDSTKGKNKKKKRKNKASLCRSEHGSKADCSRRGSGSAAVHESPFPSPHLCKSKVPPCCESCESFTLHVSSSRHFHSQPVLPDTCVQENSCAKSLMELLNESEVTSDEENCLTQDEIQSFVENNKTFYRTRDQYRQHLKDRFTQYCRGEWLPATSVN